MASLTPTELLQRLDPADQAAFLARERWIRRARSGGRDGKQLPPDDDEWQIVLFRCGRGWGKTDSLAQWAFWECWRVPGIIGHWVGPTNGDVHGTGMEGPSGLRAAIPAECLLGASWQTAYKKSQRPFELHMSNGSLIKGFGAQEEAGRLRGPQAQILLGDELRQWDMPKGNLETALNNALFGLRLPYPDGTPARALLATTSKVIPFLRRFEKRRGVRTVLGTSYENLRNLSPAFRNQLLAMEGTQMGRQEIEAAYIDEESDLSIIKRSWLKLWPAKRPLPEFSFVLESYDTANTDDNYDADKHETDETACTVWGVFNINQVFTPAERKEMRLRAKYGVLLCDAWAERIAFPDLLERARKQHRVKWGKGGRRGDVVLIEDKSSGRDMRLMLARWGVPCWPSNPGRADKAQRLHAVSPVFAQGMVFVVESGREDRVGLPRDWVDPMLEQVCAYSGPGSTERDDYVDSVSQAVHYLSQRGMLEATPEEPFVDPEEKREKEEREAAVIWSREQRQRKGNPYAA